MAQGFIMKPLEPDVTTRRETVPLRLHERLTPARFPHPLDLAAVTAERCSGFSKGYLGATGYFPLGIQLLSPLRLSSL
jgi:hypothetical protein